MAVFFYVHYVSKFNASQTNNFVSFEQLGPDLDLQCLQTVSQNILFGDKWTCPNTIMAESTVEMLQSPYTRINSVVDT